MPTEASRKPFAMLILIVALALAVSSCGRSREEAPAASVGDQEAFPITLTHALGKITIEKRPERIVTLGEDVDTLAALGITPVAYAPTAPGYSDNVPYLEDRIDLSESVVLDGSDTGQFSVEQIAAAQPDLILASNLHGIDKLYPALSKIAPTLAYEKGWGETSWSSMSLTIGKAVGREQDTAAAVARTEQYLEDLKAELPGLAGKTVTSAYYYSAGTFAANPRSESMSKYTTLGMSVSPTLLEQLPEGATDNSVSLERIDVLDADLMILSYGSEALREQLQSSPLYENLTAVRRGAVHQNDPSDALPTFAGNQPTLLNIVWLLDRQHEALVAAAQ